MTVSASTSRADYNGNGTTTAFSVPFYFLDNTHLTVVKTSTSGIPTTQVLNTHYTVSGAGVPAGGTITMVTAPNSGEKLSILRNVPIDQQTNYVPNDPFPAESHESALDKLTMIAQQANEGLTRAMSLPNNLSGVSTTLPIPQANTVIAWNETATGLQSLDPQTLATIVAFGTAKADLFSGDGTTTQFALTDNPGALNNLDVSISGVSQRNGTDFTWAGGTTVTFTSAPPSGTNNILVRYLQGLPQGATDSAASTFQQSGAGTVTRTVQDRLRDTISVKDFGAVGDGVTDDTNALTAAAVALQSGQSLYFPQGTYLISYQGSAYGSVNGNVVMSFDSKTDISLIGDGATIKCVDHDITTYGGLRFANFKSCKRVHIKGLYFDMTFTGKNTSGSYYPFCGAITAIDTDAATPAYSTICSDFLIEQCQFKLYHPLGCFSVTSNPYLGDNNNGFKVFSIFLSGPYSPTSDAYLSRNVTVDQCSWLDGHNAYGIWFWAWSAVRVTNCDAYNWVNMSTDATNTYVPATCPSIPFIRYIPFYAHGCVVQGNNFTAKKTSTRSGSYDGQSKFFMIANNLGAVNNAVGETVVSGNTVVLGGGDSSLATQDVGVYFNAFGSLIVQGNTFDGHDGESTTTQPGAIGIEYVPGSNGGNGVAELIVDGNVFGPWCNGQNIFFDNGSNTSNYQRRCKRVVITNNTSGNGYLFLRMTGYTARTYEGCRYALIANNVIDHTDATPWYAKGNAGNYGISLSGNQTGDVVICCNNTIVNKTYGVLTPNNTCATAADIRIFGNALYSLTTPYYATNQIFPGQKGFNPGSDMIVQGETGQTEASLTLKSPGANTMKFYQQATQSYIIPDNTLNLYASGASLAVVESTAFKPAVDYTVRAISLGTAALRWSVVYAGNGTINTSDERSKDQIGDIDAAVLRAWGKVNYQQFKFKDAVKNKGNAARWHFGLIAQRVKEAFESEGLDAFQFGLLCYDEWEDQMEAVPDEKGNPTDEMRVSVPAGNRYGIRYEEALALECAYLRNLISKP